MPPENARSRSGCISCRTRRKKCDEQWDDSGSCQKCAQSFFVCVRPSKVDIIARRVAKRKAAAAEPAGSTTSSGKSQGGSSSPSSATVSQQQQQQQPTGHLSAVPGPSRHSGIAPPPPPPSSSYSGGQLAVAGPSSHPAPAYHQQSDLSATLPFLNGSASPATSLLGPALAGATRTGAPPQPSPQHQHQQHPQQQQFPPSPDFSSLDFLASFPEFESLLASQGFAGDALSAPPSPAAPFAFPSSYGGFQTHDGRSTAHPGHHGHGHGAVQGRGQLAGHPGGGPHGADGAIEEIEREDAHLEGALVLKSIGVKERVAHVYNTWNSSFLRYLPTDIVESVLHWWDHVCGDSDLTKAASTMCALLFCYRQQRFSRAQKEQIAVVMRQWNQKTLSLVARSKVPFAYALLTYSDLYYYSFDQEGTAAANKFNDLAEQSMVDALGPAPKFNFCAPPGPSHYTMSILVHVAIFRSVAQARPDCFFSLSHSKEDGHDFAPITARALSAPDPPSSASARSLKLFLGLPTELIYAIALINNLAGALATLAPADVKQQAAEIEARIRGWRPSTEHMGELLDSVQYIEHFRVCEAWRHSSLVFLYQVVHRVGCMSELLQTSLRQILELATPNRAATDDSRFSTGISRAFPWFIAATVAIHPDDRAACREGLEHCGPARAYQDNLRFIQLFWDHIDVTGREPNWREFAQAQGFELGFM